MTKATAPGEPPVCGRRRLSECERTYRAARRRRAPARHGAASIIRQPRPSAWPARAVGRRRPAAGSERRQSVADQQARPAAPRPQPPASQNMPAPELLLDRIRTSGCSSLAQGNWIADHHRKTVGVHRADRATPSGEHHDQDLRVAAEEARLPSPSRRWHILPRPRRPRARPTDLDLSSTDPFGEATVQRPRTERRSPPRTMPTTATSPCDEPAAAASRPTHSSYHVCGDCATGAASTPSSPRRARRPPDAPASTCRSMTAEVHVRRHPWGAGRGD